MGKMEAPYAPTWESLNKHVAPGWFRDSKFGIMIHWGVFSVPAWAPSYQEGTGYYDTHPSVHPYAELYSWSLNHKDSPTYRYHKEHYGLDFHYDDFIPMFRAEKWDPDEWAGLFDSIGARYVVFTTTHSHDLYLWPTAFSEKNSVNMGPKRDIVGDLTRAVKKSNLKMGFYYPVTFCNHDPRFPHWRYIQKVHGQVRELVDAYSPDILWSDSYWKPEEKSSSLQWGSKELIAYYLNSAADPELVTINDRWGKEPDGLLLGDFATPEYELFDEITDFCWEAVRGIGDSFGYKQNDRYLSVQELVDFFLDVVSRNGNLLLNIGPKADGTIPEEQVERIQSFGKWLAANSAGIYGSRPWVVSDGQTETNVKVRFTAKDGAVFAYASGELGPALELRNVRVISEHTRISLPVLDRTLSWSQGSDSLRIELPKGLPPTYALCFRIDPEPFALVRKENLKRSQDGSEAWRRNGFQNHHPRLYR